MADHTQAEIISPETMPAFVASASETEASRSFQELAEAMLQNSSSRQELLTMTRYILKSKPGNPLTLLYAAKALLAEGDCEASLECMEYAVKSSENHVSLPFDLVGEIRSLLVAAVERHSQYLASGKLQQALLLTESMLRVSPEAKPFIESALSISRALGDTAAASGYERRLNEMNKAEYEQLQDLATRNHEAGRYEEELINRLAAFEHPYDLVVHNAWRLQNIHAALGCLFTKPLDAAQQQLAKRLISAVPSPYDMPDPERDDMLGRFDKFYRLSLKAVDIDAIYGPPVQQVETSQMRFADCSGRTLTFADIKQKVIEQNIQVGFFAAGTQPYFERCARYYVESILRNCDVNGLVFVCATCGWDTAENVARSLGIDDDRLIVCTDLFDYAADKFLVYTTHDIKPDDACPHHGTHYYACVGLLHLDMFIKDIGIPVFLSGMDTVLQRGVADIIEKFKDADIVVNQSSLGKHMSSTLVNSLQLVYPTDNAMLFASFMKSSLGNAIRQVQQHFAMDQLYLFMAMHHLLANGVDPQVRFFDEFDINNCMFNADNVEACREHLEKFRFVNIFHGGQADKALSGDQIMT